VRSPFSPLVDSTLNSGVSACRIKIYILRSLPESEVYEQLTTTDSFRLPTPQYHLSANPNSALRQRRKVNDGFHDADLCRLSRLRQGTGVRLGENAADQKVASCSAASGVSACRRISIKICILAPLPESGQSPSRSVAAVSADLNTRLRSPSRVFSPSRSAASLRNSLAPKRSGN